MSNSMSETAERECGWDAVTKRCFACMGGWCPERPNAARSADPIISSASPDLEEIEKRAVVIADQLEVAIPQYTAVNGDDPGWRCPVDWAYCPEGGCSVSDGCQRHGKDTVHRWKDATVVAVRAQEFCRTDIPALIAEVRRLRERGDCSRDHEPCAVAQSIHQQVTELSQALTAANEKAARLQEQLYPTTMAGAQRLMLHANGVVGRLALGDPGKSVSLSPSPEKGSL